jgi:hypothetical protein
LEGCVGNGVVDGQVSGSWYSSGESRNVGSPGFKRVMAMGTLQSRAATGCFDHDDPDA